MPTTLIARIQNLEQYKPEEHKIYWQDDTVTRWYNVYSKLTKGDLAIYLTTRKVLIGYVEAIQDRQSVTIEKVKEYEVTNDDFLRIAEMSPENISTIKANFQPFITHSYIDLPQLEKDLTSKKYISFYIVNEASIEKIMPAVKENDRVVLVGFDGKIKWLHQFKQGKLSNLDNFKPDLFGSKDMYLDQVKSLHAKTEKPNNISAVERVMQGLLKQGFYKFNTFSEYYNIIHNKQLYLDINNEDEIEDDELTSKENENTKYTRTMALNTILYGPPGTGKTYHTINKAVQIANPGYAIENASRSDLKKEYDRLVSEGQIEFVTFHQSLSYEDFIEGIKPVEPKEGDNFLKYEIKDGIFKRLAERASKVPDTKPAGIAITENEFEKAGFYKISLGDTSNPDDDQIYKWCIANGYIALGYGDAIDFTGLKENEIQQMVPAQLEKFAAQAVNYFVHYLKTGDYVVVTYGNLLFRAVGKVTGNYEFKNIDNLHVHQFRKVDWLLKDVELPYEEIYSKQFSQQTIYRLDKREIKKEYFTKSEKSSVNEAKIKNYVLIIDEINRGNVSQIFGELITLIEEDKRSGNSEALSITLPYSKKLFSVPSNLYLIGTMNTADRSVEALDTALRRRFTFEEKTADPATLHPKKLLCNFWNRKEHINVQMDDWLEEPFKSQSDKFYELIGLSREDEKDILDNQDYDANRMHWIPDDLKMYNDDIFKGVRLDFLLKTINRRLEVLLSKDHTIGHAFFMNVWGFEDLQHVFKHKILPLLQEFFYNDFAKIGLILGNSFVEVKKADNKLFASFQEAADLANDYSEKVIYELKDPMQLDIKGFQSIYQSGS